MTLRVCPRCRRRLVRSGDRLYCVNPHCTADIAGEQLVFGEKRDDGWARAREGVA